MNGLRRATLVAVFALLACLLAAASASAASLVVQQREAGPRLVAHAYESPDANTTRLKLAFVKGAKKDAVTAFDFDRDGRRDGLVYVTDNPGALVATMYDLRARPLVGDCLTFTVAEKVGTDVAATVAFASRTTTDLVTITLPALWRTTFGSLARYQPQLLTIAGDNLGGSSDAHTIGRDYLPTASAPAAEGDAATRCNDGPGLAGRAGQRHTMTAGTDRGQSGAPARTQTMTDLVSGDANDADLASAAIEQWSAANVPSGDATADAAPGTATATPTDLVLRFAPGAPLESATYLENPQNGEVVLVRTKSAGAGRIALDLHEDVVAGPAGCFAKDPTPTSSARLTVDLPVSDAAGTRTARVALDSLLGLYEGGSVVPVPAFTWLSAGLDAGVADYVPDLTADASACNATDGSAPLDGVRVAGSGRVRFSQSLPNATLTAPAATRGVPVTLTAGGGTQYRFDTNATGAFDGEGGPTRQPTYGQPTLARVLVRDGDGDHQMATLQVTPQNAAPSSVLAPKDPAYTLNCSAAQGGTVTPTFRSDPSTDPGGGTITGRAWTISGPGGFATTGNAATFSPTLRTPGSYTVTLRVTDDEGAADPTPDTHTFTVADSPATCVTKAALVRVDPAPGQLVFAGRPVTFSAGGSTFTGGGGRFAFDLDGDGTFETDTGADPVATTTYATAGTRTVRVRIIDGGGTTAEASVTVDVLPAPDKAPTVRLAAPDALELKDGRVSATLDATGSTGNNPDTSLTYAWDTDGDGTYDRTTGGDPKTEVTFTTRGARTVRVQATDAYGNRGTAEREIVVRDAVDTAAGCTGREAFRTVTFGPARGAACWTRVDRPNAGPLWIATGALNLNGLTLTGATGSTAVKRTFPDCTGTCAAANERFNDGRNGVAIALDPYDGKLVSNAPIAVRAEGAGVNLPLSLSPVDWTLPYSPRDDGFIVRVPKGGALFSLPVDGEAEVRFPSPGATTVKLNVQLPGGVLPGVSGAAEVNATPSQGVVLDRLKVDVGTGLLGSKLVIRDLGFEYERAAQLWAGNAKITLPGPRPFDLGVEVAIKDGRFQKLAGEVNSINQHLGKGIFLQRVAASVALNPLDLSGGIGLSAGPRIRNIAILRFDGDMRLRFPSDAAPYHLFQLTGEATIANALPLADAFVQFTDNGFVEARGGVGGDYSIGYFRAEVGGWMTESAANMDGSADVGLIIDGRKLSVARARAVLSSVGVAACGGIPVIDLEGGLGAKWSNMQLSSFWGCDLGPYTAARPADAPARPFSARAAQAPRRGHAVTLPKGLKSVALQVKGRGGVPRFTIVDARGRTVVEAGDDTLDRRKMVLWDVPNTTSSVLWKAPRAGRYTVVAAPGSPAIASVRSALGTPPPAITTRVEGRGERRVVRWRVTPALQRGQRLVLAERAAGVGGAPIVRTAKSRGSVAYRPVIGPRGTRTVQATIETDGFAGKPRTVARFTPPRLTRPAAPRVTLERRGRTVVARWRPRGAAAADQWQLDVAVGASRRDVHEVSGATRTFRIADVPAAQPVRVAVRGTAGARALIGRPGGDRLKAGETGAGTSGARPRGLRVRRAGRGLRVTWKAGPERVRAFTVTIRPSRGKAIRLTAHPRRPGVTLRTAPKGRLAVEVRAQRLAGGSAVARATLRR